MGPEDSNPERRKPLGRFHFDMLSVSTTSQTCTHPQGFGRQKKRILVKNMQGTTKYVEFLRIFVKNANYCAKSWKIKC